MKKITLLLITLLGTGHAFAQFTQYNLSSLFQKNRLTAVNRSFGILEDDLENGIKVGEGKGEGLLWINRATFSDGIIEIDLRGQDVFQHSFLGVAFHGVDDKTYDAVYFRPFNFNASDPVRKIHAVQYISHPDHNWKKLRDENPGEFEKGIASAIDPNGWFHVRMDVTGTRISVFINDGKNPELVVNKLNNRRDGTIGLFLGEGSGGEFANLKIRPLAKEKELSAKVK